jgi:hypothetical protein
MFCVAYSAPFLHCRKGDIQHQCQLGKFIFRCLSTGDDFNLGRGACMKKPSLNDLPRDCEESRGIDNDHFGHGLGKVKRINKGLFLDNRQRAASKLRRRQVVQVQHTEAFKATVVSDNKKSWLDTFSDASRMERS